MECKVCWKVFENPKDATEHYNIFKSHENYENYAKIKPFECDSCKVRFMVQEDLDQHKKIHDKNKEDIESSVPIKVEKKPKKYVDQDEKCSKEPPSKKTNSFVCKVCGKGFQLQKNLDNHMTDHNTYEDDKYSKKLNSFKENKNSMYKQEFDHVDVLSFNIPEKELTMADIHINSKIDFNLEDTVYSQASDSADVRVVELNAKTIELSSSDDEFKDLDIVKKEIFFDTDGPFNDYDVEEEKPSINSIKIENEMDDTNGSDDFPLNQLILKAKCIKSEKTIRKKRIKNEKKTQNASEKTTEPKKREIKKRVSKKEKNLDEKKTTTKKSKVKCEVSKDGETSEILVVQPDIFLDNNKDSKKDVENNEDSSEVLPKHRCSACGERRSNKRLLQQHKQIHNGMGETECKVCRQIFGTPQEVLLHFDSFRKEKSDKHYQEGRPYQCKDCDSRFIHLKHLYEHRKIHIGDKKYLCKLCDKSFLRKQGLQWHLETHLSDELDAESLKDLTGIKVRDNVLNKKMFVCDICGHEFKQSSQLKIHINRHYKLKRFTCTICAKSFVTPRDLLKHSRTHTGERPYQCSYCEKRFIDSGDKIKHERLHTGEKPYTCQTCGKKFTFSSGLRTHERAVHFGLKRYNCDKCTRGFSNKSCLLKHKAKIHLQR